MPKERTVFTGNLTGPLFGHVPNLYTLRAIRFATCSGIWTACNA